MLYCCNEDLDIEIPNLTDNTMVNFTINKPSESLSFMRRLGESMEICKNLGFGLNSNMMFNDNFDSLS